MVNSEVYEPVDAFCELVFCGKSERIRGRFPVRPLDLNQALAAFPLV